jgi:hypothetical protein
LVFEKKALISSVEMSFFFKTHTVGVSQAALIKSSSLNFHKVMNFSASWSLRASVGTITNSLLQCSFINAPNIVSVLPVQVGITIVDVFLETV